MYQRKLLREGEKEKENLLRVRCLELCPTLDDSREHSFGVNHSEVVTDASLWVWLLVDLDSVVLLRVAAAIALPVSLLQLRV